ncbi:MAG: hypothetical protein M3N13_02605 [Candidatus Eremiobacteraeota bacterium]|nr:hypothetical protein [Candidatus Eremiobacteraeota bacterium]
MTTIVSATCAAPAMNAFAGEGADDDRRIDSHVIGGRLHAGRDYGQPQREVASMKIKRKFMKLKAGENEVRILPPDGLEFVPFVFPFQFKTSRGFLACEGTDCFICAEFEYQRALSVWEGEGGAYA